MTLKEELEQASNGLNDALADAEKALQEKDYSADASVEIREGVKLVFVGGYLGIKRKDWGEVTPLGNAKLDDRILAAHMLPKLEELVRDLSYVGLDKVREAAMKARDFARRTRATL
jgi:hypothetical protein